MTNTPYHTIQKEVLDISFPNYDSARQWEISGRQNLLHAIQNALERSFAAYENGTYLVIDRLELDMGAFTSPELRREMPERIYRELKIVLEGVHSKSTGAEPSSGNQTESSRNSTSSSSRHTIHHEQVLSSGTGRLKSFLFFLRNGCLPWWATAFSEWDESWLARMKGAEWASITQFFKYESHIPSRRITSQFSDTFLRAMVQGMGVTSDPLTNWRWLLQLLTSHIAQAGLEAGGNSPVDLQSPEPGIPLYRDKRDADSRKAIAALVKNLNVQELKLRQRYWITWINHAAGLTGVPELTKIFEDDAATLNIIRQVLAQMVQMDDLSISSFLERMPPSWKKELEEVQAFTNQVPQRESSVSHKRTEQDTTLKSEGLIKPGTALDPSKRFALDDPQRDHLKKENSSIEQAEMMMDAAAGVILLHPFLPQLFEQLDWLEKKKFRDEDRRTRAVWAIHYLATGSTDAPEHQLLLPKILCGIAWETPLEPVEPTGPDIKSACDELLAAVIAHWKALRNTSPDGLREAFLQRRGKLEALEKGWRLEVEPKAQDVLLGHLPWGISMIRYPWMEGMLSCSWD